MAERRKKRGEKALSVEVQSRNGDFCVVVLLSSGRQVETLFSKRYYAENCARYMRRWYA